MMKKRKSKFLLLAIICVLFMVNGNNGQKKIIKDLFYNLKNEWILFNNQAKTSEKNPKGLNLPKNKLIPVTLDRHVDGDTTQFIINGDPVKVRYLLIDTPETVKPGTEVQPFGIEASNGTKMLLTDAEEISIMLDDGEVVDRYDRVLAYVFVDGVLVQDVLVKEGLARIAYVKSKSSSYLPQLQLSEKKAKRNKLGIWSLDGYVTDKGFNH